MNEYQLQKLLDSPLRVQKGIQEYLDKGILSKQHIDTNEIKGHIAKADHNLKFISDVIPLHYLDWALTGCYYACYHGALALIQTKGYTSKNHLATLYILIKEFYTNSLTAEDLTVLCKALEYEDVLFYVESKGKREDATYSTHILYDTKDVEQLRIKTVLFVNKIKELVQN